MTTSPGSARRSLWTTVRRTLPILEDGVCTLTSLDDPDLHPADRAAMVEWGEVATLAVPLRFRDEGVVGCLTLIEKREGRRFTEEDCELVTLLAGPAAVAVRNARLFRLQQEQNRYLASLLDSARAITSTVTLEDSLDSICRTAAEALETGECMVYEYDAARDAIVFRAFHGVGRAAGVARGGHGLPAGRLSLGPRDPAPRGGRPGDALRSVAAR